MANAFSVPASMGQYVDPVNEGLINQVLQSKDKKYDYNVAKIDNLIQQYTSLPLVRDKDKQYLEGRINNVLNVVNKVNKLNMSNGNVTRQIEQNISTAIDDEVIKQISNSKSIMNFEQSVAQKREKKPELYSDVNYSYAKKMAGYDLYMNGEKDEIGSLQYADFKDVPKKINDFIIDIQNKKKDQVVTMPAKDGNGQVIPGSLIQTTISGLTPFQVRELAESQLDASYNRQVEINGWYNAGGYEGEAKEKLSADVKTVFDNQIGNLDVRKLELERKLTNAGSESDKVAIQSELDGIGNQKSVLEKNRDSLMSSPQAAATFIEKERVLSNAQDAFGSLYSENSKVVKDEIYFAQQDLNLKRLKFEYDVEKDRKSAATDSSAPNAVINTLPTPLEGSIEDIETFIDKSVETYSTNVNADLMAYRNALQTESSKGNAGASRLMQEYQKKLLTKKPGESDEDVFASVVSTIDYNDSNAIIGNRNYVADIKNNKEKLNLLLEGKNKAVENAKMNHIDLTINTDDTFQAFYNNPETKMLWNGSNGRQQAFSIKDVLISNGLMDATGKKIGDIKTKPKLLAALQQSYYADAFISRKNKGEYLKKLAGSFGESLSDVAPGRVNTNATLDINGINFNTKTGQFIKQARERGINDSGFGIMDNSLSSDDSTIARFINQDYKSNDLYKQDLERFYNKLPTTQVIGVTAQDKAAYNKLGALITSQPGSTFTPEPLSKNATINLRLEGDYVIASQNQNSTAKGVTTTAPVVTKILKKDFLRDMPELANRLSFQTEAAFYTLDKLEGRTLKSESVKFFDGNTEGKVFDYNTKVTLANNPSLAPFLSSSMARDTLIDSNKILMEKYGNFPDIVTKALSESSNYTINAKIERGFDGNPIMDIKLIDKKTQKLIHTIRNSTDMNLDNFKQILDNTPQVFYGIMVDDIFKKEAQEYRRGSTLATPEFKNLTDSLPN